MFCGAETMWLSTPIATSCSTLLSTDDLRVLGMLYLSHCPTGGDLHNAAYIVAMQLLTTYIATATLLPRLILCYNYSDTGPFSIDPYTVPDATRQSWCLDQGNLCIQMCNNITYGNSCDAVSCSHQVVGR